MNSVNIEDLAPVLQTEVTMRHIWQLKALAEQKIVS